METDSNIYKAPESDVTVGTQQERKAVGDWKPTIVAFLLSAPITGLLLGVAMVMMDDRSNVDFSMMVGVGIYGSLISYIVVLLLGLPLHWFLGRIERRRYPYYLIAGAVIPAPFILVFEMADDPYGWLLLSGSGALCASLFWFLWFFTIRRLQR